MSNGDPKALNRLRLQVFGAATLTLLSWISISATITVLPRIVSADLGASDVVVGLTSGIYGVSSILVRPLAGRLSDAMGRARVGAAGSLFLIAGALMLFLPMSVELLALSRIVAGVGLGAVIVSMLALIVDVAPAGERAYWVGFNGMAMWLAFAIGPPIAEFLRVNAGFEAIWAFSAAAPLAGCLLAGALPAGSAAPPASDEPLPLIAREALAPGLMLALAACSVAALSGFLILHLEHRGIAHAAFALSLFGISVVITRLFVGRLPDRYDPAACTLISLVGQSIGLALIAVAPNLLVTCAGTAIIGAAFSLIFPSLALIVTRRAPPARRGVAIGTYSSSLDVGMLIGGPLLGAVAALAGYAAGFAAAAAIALAGAWLCWLMFSPRFERSA